MTARTPVSTDLAPAAIGPYHQAIVAGGVAYCSGQVALSPTTGELVGANVTEQAEQVIENMRAVLDAAGSSFGQVLRCTVFLLDMADFQAVNAVYARAFEGVEPPSRACVAVAALPKGALVEIDCIALVS